MEIEVLNEDITKIKTDAIVNPANSQLRMGGGLAGLIKKKGGKQIENEARKKAPIKVGDAVLTSGGKLPARHVIHAPTMNRPAEKIPVKNVKKAMSGILRCAEKNKLKEIAVPGLGTGVGGVPFDEAAEAMIKEIGEYDHKTLKKIKLIGYKKELYDSFLKWKKKLTS